EQSKWPHRQSELDDHAIDFFGRRQSFLQDVESLIHVREQQSVDEEPRTLLHAHRNLMELAAKLHGGVRRLSRSLESRDDFDQLHGLRRVEEVHADYAIRTSGRGSNFRNGECRRIGGQNRARLTDFVELAEQLELYFYLLERSFDDDVDVFEPVVGGRSFDHAE